MAMYLSKALTLVCLAGCVLCAHPLDFDAQFKILKRVHLASHFSVVLAQNLKTQKQSVFFVDENSPFRVQTDTVATLNKTTLKTIQALYDQATSDNFDLKHAKQFRAFVRALPLKNMITLESLSKSPSEEIYFFNLGSLAVSSVVRIKQLIKTARVHLVLFGEFEGYDNSYQSATATYFATLKGIQSTLEKIKLLEKISQQDEPQDHGGLDVNAIPPSPDSPLYDLPKQNTNLAFKYGLGEIRSHLPLFYTLSKKQH